MKDQNRRVNRGRSYLDRLNRHHNGKKAQKKTTLKDWQAFRE